jgi:hypothetical protein
MDPTGKKVMQDKDLCSHQVQVVLQKEGGGTTKGSQALKAHLESGDYT